MIQPVFHSQLFLFPFIIFSLLPSLPLKKLMGAFWSPATASEIEMLDIFIEYRHQQGRQVQAQVQPRAGGRQSEQPLPDPSASTAKDPHPATVSLKRSQ